MFNEEPSGENSNGEDLSGVNPIEILDETTPNNNKNKKKAGRKRGPVWTHFNELNVKKDGHSGCKCIYCGWSQNRGESAQMQAHLALSCSKVPSTVKAEYLILIKHYAEEQVASTSSKQRRVDSVQTKVDRYYQSNQIDNTKQALCNRAVAKFFICCNVAFRLVSHPFFIDMVKTLCNGYKPPCVTTLSNALMNDKLANIVAEQQLTLEKESDLTLGMKSTLIVL
jgi:hypothetical protein